MSIAGTTGGRVEGGRMPIVRKKKRECNEKDVRQKSGKQRYVSESDLCQTLGYL